MKIPWVPRAAFDAVQAALEAARADVMAERDRYERLVADMQEMQRQGFSAPPAPSSPPTVKRLPGPVAAAITSHMNPKGAAWRNTAHKAHAWLEAGVHEPEVVRRVHAGAGWTEEDTA